MPCHPKGNSKSWARSSALDERPCGEDVGLPQGVNHRRTPGLRREELAQLAGISVSWYTRLEQGKDVQPSAKAVARVAQALQLTAAQREYLLALARRDPLGAQPAPAEPVSGTMRDVLDAQGGNPAYLIDARLNLAWNQAAISVFGFAEDLLQRRRRSATCCGSSSPTTLARGWSTASGMPSSCSPSSETPHVIRSTSPGLASSSSSSNSAVPSSRDGGPSTMSSGSRKPRR